MKVATGKIIGGKVVIDDATFADGATVTVLAHEDDEAFEVSPEMENALLMAIGEAEGGETIPGEELLAKLQHRA